MNNFATMIQDNRLLANAQLTADDLGAVWNDYRLLCDKIAIEAYRIVTTRHDGDCMGTCLYNLLKFFDADAAKYMGVRGYQTRIVCAAVARKRVKSVELKRAERERNDFAKKLNDFKTIRETMKTDDAEVRIKNEATCMYDLYNVKMVDNAIVKLTEMLEAQQAIVDALYEEKGNCFNEFQPMLGGDKKRASAKCRKAIEDTIADILFERSIMTIEEMQREAADLKEQRRIRKNAEKRENAGK